MHHYSIFGGTLHSTVPIPELRAGGDRPDWTLTTGAEPSPMPDATPLGELEIMAGCRVRLSRHAAGFRLHYDDTGSYDVARDGRRIVWYPGANPNAEAVRADITGRVLTTALHAAGLLCLHGSAVALPEGVVAFLAPKFHGKSTLALALARAGGRLVTDDILPVNPTPPIRAIPGVHQVKLWDDSADHFGLATRARASTEKHLLHDFDDDHLMFEEAPLAAIYLLAPLAPEEHESLPGGAERVRLSSVTAALALVRHGALGALLGGLDAQDAFDRAASVAATVPVYQLRVQPGLDRIPRTVSRLQQWHGTRVDAARPLERV